MEEKISTAEIYCTIKRCTAKIQDYVTPFCPDYVYYQMVEQLNKLDDLAKRIEEKGVKQ